APVREFKWQKPDATAQRAVLRKNAAEAAGPPAGSALRLAAPKSLDGRPAGALAAQTRVDSPRFPRALAGGALDLGEHPLFGWRFAARSDRSGRYHAMTRHIRLRLAARREFDI